MTDKQNPSLNYHLLFKNSPTPFLVLLPHHDFTIVEVNQAYLDATKTERHLLIGHSLFDAFPDNPEDPSATGVKNLRASLERVIATGEVDAMAVQRYDIPRRTSEGGGFEERYWSPVNTPVLDSGEVSYIIHRVEDVTQVVQLTKAREQERDDREHLRVRNEQIMAELISRGEQLKLVNDQLRLESRRKDEFVAMLAHELRNPLAAIGAVAELLQPTGDQDPDRARHLQVLQHNLYALKDLVESLLDLSRISRGLIELKQQWVDLTAVVHNALNTVQYLIQEKQHQVSVVCPDEPVAIYGDPVRLEQILVNLLTNAARYTDAGGRISVTLTADQVHADISVKDNGRGLSPDMFDRIFEMFGQGERNLARSEGGLGIGLTIVKRLVELHDGTVDVYSEGVGRGTEFRVCLPLEAAETAPQPEETTPTPTGTIKRLLLVEDNRDIADTLALVLERWGHDVSLAYDGPSGVEQAREVYPDLVLLDIGLPGMDGYQVARKLRETPGLEHVVLVALTGYGNHVDRQHAREAGFDAHFVKPVDLPALRSFIEGQVAKKKQ